MDAKRFAISVAAASMMAVFGPAFAQSSASDSTDSSAPAAMPSEDSQPAMSEADSSAAGSSASTDIEAPATESSELNKQDEDKASD